MGNSADIAVRRRLMAIGSDISDLHPAEDRFLKGSPEACEQAKTCHNFAG